MSIQQFDHIRSLPPNSPERRKAVRDLLGENRGLARRASRRANVHYTMASKILYGIAVSAPMEKAIEAELRG